MDEEEVKTPETPTETPSVPRWKQKLAERYPDREFADDTEAENAFYDDYESTHSKLSQSELDNKKVYELIESNPALADVIVAMNDGVPFEVALAQNVDLEALLPKEGESNYEQYASALTDRKKRMEESRSKIETIEQNRKQTVDVATKFYEDKKLDEEQITKFLDFIDGLIGDIFDGSVSRTALEKLYQAYCYEEDVEQATEQGRIDGLNSKIEKSRKVNSTTDGVPTPGTSVESPTETPAKKAIWNI